MTSSLSTALKANRSGTTSYRLDAPQWPAPPGPQHAWEPSRTTEYREHRAARLKALGNAVVPQVVYPLAVMIREFLDAENK